jgi:hypothetical protein
LASHSHHVTYDSDQTEQLCARHYAEITKVNIDHSGPGYKLFEKERERLYRSWKAGDIRPEGDPFDEPWIAEWNERKF